MKLSDALAATQTGLLASQFAGGFIRIFSGEPPADPSRAETGVLLGVVTVGALAGAGLHFTASGPALQKANETWAFRAEADGTAGWFRVVQPADDGTDSLSALRIDGTVGAPADPADMNWETLLVGAGQFYTIDSFLYLTQPV